MVLADFFLEKKEYMKKNSLPHSTTKGEGYELDDANSTNHSTNENDFFSTKNFLKIHKCYFRNAMRIWKTYNYFYTSFFKNGRRRLDINI